MQKPLFAEFARVFTVGAVFLCMVIYEEVFDLAGRPCISLDMEPGQTHTEQHASLVCQLFPLTRTYAMITQVCDKWCDSKLVNQCPYKCSVTIPQKQVSQINFRISDAR